MALASDFPLSARRYLASTGPEITRQLADAVTRSEEKTQNINIYIIYIGKQLHGLTMY